MPDHPMDPLTTLGRRMRDLAEELGCDMDAFIVMPDLDGHGHLMQVVFVLPPAPAKPAHPELVGVDIDAEAERLLASIEEHERVESRKSMNEDAVERLLGVHDRLHEDDDNGPAH